jgi:3-hydroxyacyl-CoA dehydrogenase/enoyl-CoA hydratase/3-hydroxybutyryl-CoA epimerase
MNSPVTFCLDADRVAWIVFDDPASRANVLNAETRAAFGAAISEVGASAAKAVIVTGGKDRIFIAGADLKELAGLPDAAAASEFSRDGQDLFRRLGNLKVPVVCAIHGTCAGGGFELALACHWRIASDRGTQIGLPEVGLGTIPGWGGTVRLPRLIGASAALDHILKAKLLPAEEAAKLGIVDEIVPPAKLKATAKAVALQLAAAGRLRVRPSPPFPASGLFEGLRHTVLAGSGDERRAPLVAIDVVERGLEVDMASALRIEAGAFGELAAGTVCRNHIRAFFLRDSAKKRTLDGWFQSASPQQPSIKRVGVVGAGVMGSGIAQCLAANGYEVVLRDIQRDLIERSRGSIARLFNEAVGRGKLSAEHAAASLGRIAVTTAWEGFGSCDLVIEAIVENAADKRKLFTELAGIVRPETLLASNTSALPIEVIAGNVPNPGRVVGLHFFNPVSRMTLVELILGHDTTRETAGRALAFVRTLGKSPVICRSSPGFLVTRVLFFYLNEAVKLWERGVPADAIDSALCEFGWPMGPMRLIDEVGIDVTDLIFREMEHYFPGRFARTRTCAAMVAAGLRGRKEGTGNGFYLYAQGKESLNDHAARKLDDPVSPRSEHPSEITARLMDVMVDEARLCLEERVVHSEDDIDFALLAGAGFPASRGGLMRYALTREAFLR